MGGGVTNCYYDLSEIGLTTACTLTELINALPNHSKIQFWLSNDTNIRTEVLNIFGIASSNYGIFSIENHDNNVYSLEFRTYNDPNLYTIRYTKVNSLGFSKALRFTREKVFIVTGVAATHQVIIDKWDELPNGTFTVSVQSTDVAPYEGTAFGYRNGLFGNFIFMNYYDNTIKKVLMYNGAATVESI